MRILVVGDGKVGHTVAEQLTREGHDVVIIDKNEDVLQRCEDTLDVLCIRGNGANARTLLDAGVEKADFVVAATASDETNMLCCLIAKRLGARYTIARIRDPEYNESLSLLQRETSIDNAINPERATALEISRLLRFPFANNIETFAKGQIEMVEFRVQENDVVVGCPLHALSSRLPGIPRVLYAIVERSGEVIIPNGDFVIHAGDRVHVAGDMVTITNYFRFLGKHSLRVKNVMLLGGGRISYYLAKMIVPMGMHVAMIEINPKKAESLSESLPHVNVILGDGTDQELLEQEGLESMDAFIAMCDRDEENLLMALTAKRYGVKKVVPKMSRMGYLDIVNLTGLDTVISPKAVIAGQISSYVRGLANSQGSAVESLHYILGGAIEAVEFTATSATHFLDRPLSDLHFRNGLLVAAIVHNGRMEIPNGHSQIHAGDRVIVVAKKLFLQDLNDILSRLQPFRHVELVRDQHVFRFADLFSIEEYVGERINPIEDQHCPLAGFGVKRRSGERARVQPFISLVWTKLEDVQTNLWLGQYPDRNEVEFAGSGHGRIGSLVFRDVERPHGSVVRLREVVEFPFSIERNRRSAEGHCRANRCGGKHSAS